MAHTPYGYGLIGRADGPRPKLPAVRSLSGPACLLRTNHTETGPQPGRPSPTAGVKNTPSAPRNLARTCVLPLPPLAPKERRLTQFFSVLRHVYLPTIAAIHHLLRSGRPLRSRRVGNSPAPDRGHPLTAVYLPAAPSTPPAWIPPPAPLPRFTVPPNAGSCFFVPNGPQRAPPPLFERS